MSEETKKCNKCSNCVLEDYGYSNWTVEGTYVHCSKKKHPDAPFDQFYGEDERLDFAKKCDSFESGNPITVDVDQEGPFSPEERQAIEACGIDFWRTSP